MGIDHTRLDFRSQFLRVSITVFVVVGLICFEVCYGIDSSLEPGYICNPITREFILLPKSKSQGKHFLTGFGYSPLTHEYKVVKIHNSKGDPDFGTVQVYTLGSGIGWRNVGKIDYDVEYFSKRGAFVNTSVHWVDKKGTIFAFDLADEEFRVIPSPPCLVQAGNGPCIVKLEVVGDFLCAIIKNVGDSWDMWFLKKNKSYQDVIWSEKFSIFSQSMVRPLTFDKSGELLAYDFVDKSVYRYTPEVSSPRMLVNFNENIRLGTPHKNTFVSLKALGEENTKRMDSGERAGSSGETKSSCH